VIFVGIRFMKIAKLEFRNLCHYGDDDTEIHKKGLPRKRKNPRKLRLENKPKLRIVKNGP
jgi:hypothetical protein